MGLTPKQKEILDYISHSTAENGYSPSQKEIAEHFGFKSLGTVQDYLVRLQEQGLLKKEWNARRGTVAVLPKKKNQAVPSEGQLPISDSGFWASAISAELPVLGKVAAGRPIEAAAKGASIQVPREFMASSGEHFVLQVSGDSMIEDGILDGDWVVIRKQLSAANGDTVVARIGNEATIKRFFKTADKIELWSANSKYKPILVDAQKSEHFQIEGILTGVLRRVSYRV